MYEPILFREIKLENGWLMIRPERNEIGKVLAFLRKMRDKLYLLDIREYRKKRSRDANAYAWVLIGKLAEAMRIPKDEVYREAIRGIGGNYEIIPIRQEACQKFIEIWTKRGTGWQCDDLGDSKINGYRNVIAYYGSSVYDTHQMSVLIDRLVQDCKDLGIETLSDEKLSLLMEEWDGKQKEEQFGRI